MALVWAILLLMMIDNLWADTSDTLGIPCDRFDGDEMQYAKLIIKTSMRNLYVYGTEWGHYYPCPDCRYKPLSLNPISNVFGSLICVYLDGDPRYLIGVSQQVPYSGCNGTDYITSSGNTSECVWKPSKWIISPISQRFRQTGHYAIFIKGKDDVKKTTLREPMKKYPFYVVPAVVVLGCAFGFMYWRHRKKKGKQQWISDEDRLELAPLKDN